MQLHSFLIRLCKNKARVEVFHVLLTICSLQLFHFLLQEPAPTLHDGPQQDKSRQKSRPAKNIKYGQTTSCFSDYSSPKLLTFSRGPTDDSPQQDDSYIHQLLSLPLSLE